MAVAAVLAISDVVGRSEASTVLELFVELRASIDALQHLVRKKDVLSFLTGHSNAKRLTILPMQAACELYQQFAVKHYDRNQNMPVDALKVLMLEQSAKFSERVKRSKQTIAEAGSIMFTCDQMIVLTYGCSSCVEAVLCHAWKVHKKRFSVIIAQPLGVGEDAAVNCFRKELESIGICASTFNAAAVGTAAQRADIVLVGAEAVLPSGGIINKGGTATIAMVTSQLRIPFYVACEACKFTRAGPSTQGQAPQMRQMPPRRRGELSICGVSSTLNDSLDITPPSLIDLLFTDLGVFTPSSVAEELYKFYSKTIP
eukprot:GHVT01054633.1.p1 GENE.GHVT01054633.1~~GHVT01054633.1.p1  ORF type:complete len:314 (+),score=81.23 GHVT01054633.1:1057-1998(+)